MMDQQDDDVKHFIHDMRMMSSLAYRFAQLRLIVRKNEGRIERTGPLGYFGFGEGKEIRFDTPALIITQEGAQGKKDNAYLKYPITPDAILEFIGKNRKYLEAASPGSPALKFDPTENEEKETFRFEETLQELKQDNMKIIDFEDKFSTKEGGLVYSVMINLTQKWIAVAFRGTIGTTDAWTDLNFNLDTESFFEDETFISVEGNKPGTHAGFTGYLHDARDGAERSYYERIIACLRDQFEKNEDVKGKGFKLYVTGHSLGGGLANLFGFRVAQLKSMDHESVKSFPPRVKIMSFAAPCVGDQGYNKEFQELEKKRILRHIRISNEGDVVPTMNIGAPYRFMIRGDTSLYTQNGVNLCMRDGQKMELSYRNTKEFSSVWKGALSASSNAFSHYLTTHEDRMELDVNMETYEQTVEELYQIAGDFTN